ncbi:hypothetical protein V2J09_020040 [Rumex salicifolius]
MENYIHSFRERVFIAEIRADAAESKVSELTEMNMELTNELEFLKGIKIDSEKMNLLEKQVSHLEKELEHSKAKAKTSQEQQKELYTAIFDMETLIEDLKSKAFLAETRLEKVEEQCLLLAESNSELDLQLSRVQSRAERLEASLNEFHREKGSKVEDINNGAKIVADLVLKLALERKRIQITLCSLAKENKILMEELRKSRKSHFKSSNGKVDNTKRAYSSVNGLSSTVANGSVEKPSEIPWTISQLKVNDLMEPATSNENEEKYSKSPENAADCHLGIETKNKQNLGNQNIRFILIVILVPILSAGAMLTALRYFFSL